MGGPGIPELISQELEGVWEGEAWKGPWAEGDGRRKMGGDTWMRPQSPRETEEPPGLPICLFLLHGIPYALVS